MRKWTVEMNSFQYKNNKWIIRMKRFNYIYKEMQIDSNKIEKAQSCKDIKIKDNFLCWQ